MQLETIKENSFKNFHAKGLHYLCLERTPLHTLKAYFFEGDVANCSEVAVPHNHRYNFLTEVLAGELIDKEYKEVEPSLGIATRVAQKWDYMTPLNGGDGFKWQCETRLWWYGERTKSVGQVLYSPQDRIHTIMVKPDTVLLLTQMRDKLPLDVPSQAYSFGTKEQTPNTSGLYDKFTDDEITAYLRQLDALGVAVPPVSA